MFINTGEPPKAPELHRWADWAEILAFTSASEEFSVSDLSEAIDREKANLESDPYGEADGGSEESETLIEDLTEGEAAFQDAIQKRSFDVVGYLEDRSERFKEAYPFEVDKRTKRLVLAEPSPARSLYVLLLACSALRYVQNERRSEHSNGSISSALTSHFEILGFQTLKHLLPPNAEVRLFGKNAHYASGYEGKLRKKVKLLAKDLGEVVIAKKRDFNKRDSGDNGLDLVAWIPLGDSLPGRPLFFAQCACTPLWVTKQHSSGASAWNRTISLIADPENLVFIPFDYRIPGGDWYIERKIQKSVVVDRQRILHALGAIDGRPRNLDTILPQEFQEFINSARASDALDI